MAVDTSNIDVHELTGDEARDLLDGMARYYLGISGSEFVEGWESGRIKLTDCPEVIRVAALVQLGRENAS